MVGGLAGSDLPVLLSRVWLSITPPLVQARSFAQFWTWAIDEEKGVAVCPQALITRKLLTPGETRRGVYSPRAREVTMTRESSSKARRKHSCGKHAICDASLRYSFLSSARERIMVSPVLVAFTSSSDAAGATASSCVGYMRSWTSGGR